MLELWDFNLEKAMESISQESSANCANAAKEQPCREPSPAKSVLKVANSISEELSVLSPLAVVSSPPALERNQSVERFAEFAGLAVGQPDDSSSNDLADCQDLSQRRRDFEMATQIFAGIGMRSIE